MSDRDWVGHPDFNPKGTRSNLHSQHKCAGRLQAQSATGRDSWNCQQQENLIDCRTQVIFPRPLVPAKLSMKAKQKGTERDRERQRERERGRETNNKKVELSFLGEGAIVPSRSLVGAASREENESSMPHALIEPL